MFPSQPAFMQTSRNSSPQGDFNAPRYISKLVSSPPAHLDAFYSSGAIRAIGIRKRLMLAGKRHKKEDINGLM